MSEPEIKSFVIDYKPEALLHELLDSHQLLRLGAFRQAWAFRDNTVGMASVEQIATGPGASQFGLLVRAVLFWRDCEVAPMQCRKVEPPALTWESTDNELIAAAVQILEHAEGVK